MNRDPLTAKLKMGVIPENGTVYSDFIAEQNILITAKFYGMDRKCREIRAEEILSRLWLIFVSGIFIPPGQLNGWMWFLTSFSPLTYLVDLFH